MPPVLPKGITLPSQHNCNKCHTLTRRSRRKTLNTREPTSVIRTIEGLHSADVETMTLTRNSMANDAITASRSIITTEPPEIGTRTRTWALTVDSTIMAHPSIVRSECYSWAREGQWSAEAALRTRSSYWNVLVCVRVRAHNFFDFAGTFAILTSMSDIFGKALFTCMQCRISHHKTRFQLDQTCKSATIDKKTKKLKIWRLIFRNGKSNVFHDNSYWRENDKFSLQVWQFSDKK